MDFLRLIQDFFIYDENHPLTFLSTYFWVFYTLLLGLYSFIYKKNPVRNAFLFFVSLFFYYKTGGFFFTILLFSTVTDYLLGFKIASSNRKKIWLAISIILNLSVLVFFKYAYFFTDILNQLFETAIVPRNFFAEITNSVTSSTFRVDQILLPVGISFFTFQTMSYAIDIYRNKIKPVKSLIDFGFYVSFFPQLVAGPIVRASDFVPQLYEKYQLTKRDFGMAIFWILNGFLKKVFLADYLAVQLIDRVFDDPSRFSGFENLMALYGYSLQVYADFSGYTDMAIGLAALMGFRLPKNFNSPYKAHSVADFWKRWHISLSSWLKDYLYIPMGGNRGGSFFSFLMLFIIALFVALLAGNIWYFVLFIGFVVLLVAIINYLPTINNHFTTNINLLLTMLIGGLWHGASWNFVIWGALNGIGLIVFKYWQRVSPWEDKKKWFNRVWGIFLTFQFITFTRIWFRTGSHTMWDELDEKHNILAELFSANDMLYQITNHFNASIIPDVLTAYWQFFLVLLLGFIIHWLPKKQKLWYREIFIRSHWSLKMLASVIAIIFAYQVMGPEIKPFIYFQF